MDDTWCCVATLCPCGGEKNGFVLNRLETERERERERTERERDKRIEKDGVWEVMGKVRGLIWIIRIYNVVGYVCALCYGRIANLVFSSFNR